MYYWESKITTTFVVRLSYPCNETLKAAAGALVNDEWQNDIFQAVFGDAMLTILERAGVNDTDHVWFPPDVVEIAEG